MDRLKLSLLGAVAMAAVNAGGLGTAAAADLLPPPPIVEAPEVVVKKSGWYLRGDISYDFQEVHDTHFTLNGQTYHPDLDDAFNIGLGVGYQVTDNFRVDLTGEYVFGAHYGFQTGGNGGPCGGVTPHPTATYNCASTERSEVSKFKLLGNAYYDIGHFGGFTPYVGAGIGGAYVKYDDLRTTETCTVTTTIATPAGYQHCPDPHAPPVATIPTAQTTTSVADVQEFKGNNEWRFAYALHAGGSYAINDHLKLDIGYTYSRIEGGKAFDYVGRGNEVFGKNGFYDDGFTDHTIRAGLRYHLW